MSASSSDATCSNNCQVDAADQKSGSFQSKSLAVEPAPQFLDLEFDDAANGCVLARPGPSPGST
jgi:hypothetical protein